jgi:hypothetical protein
MEQIVKDAVDDARALIQGRIGELLKDAESGLEMAGLTSDQFTVYGLPF